MAAVPVWCRSHFAASLILDSCLVREAHRIAANVVVDIALRFRLGLITFSGQCSGLVLRHLTFSRRSVAQPTPARTSGSGIAIPRGWSHQFRLVGRVDPTLHLGIERASAPRERNWVIIASPASSCERRPPSFAGVTMAFSKHLESQRYPNFYLRRSQHRPAHHASISEDRAAGEGCRVRMTRSGGPSDLHV